MSNLIYLDYAATTPLDPRVAEKMVSCLKSPEQFGNAASRTHQFGQTAACLIEIAREQVAQTINAPNSDGIVFTSGATEANNLAIKGIAEFHQRRGKHIITWQTEHHAILDVCDYLSRHGYFITYLKPGANGQINLDELAANIRDDTILISLVYVNSETGIVQDAKRIIELAHERGVFCHLDAAQAIGKINVDVQDLKIDLMSLSAHKAYGPKGMGALYIKQQPRVRLTAQIQGGGHEHGIRSGTLPTHQIIGMGEAFNIAKRQLAEDQLHAKACRDALWQGLQSCGEVILNSDSIYAVPTILNVSFAGIDNAMLLQNLPDIAVSTGSACTSGSLAPSYVLTAMGLSRELASSAVRFSFGRFTTLEEIKRAIAETREALRKLSYNV